MTTTTIQDWARRLSGTWESDPSAGRVSFRVRSFGIIPVTGNVPRTLCVDIDVVLVRPAPTRG